MYKGDTKEIKLKIKSNNQVVEYNLYDEIEVQFNYQNSSKSIKKLLSNNDIEFIDEYIICKLSQEDTFNLNVGKVSVQVRLLLNDNCKATALGYINVKDSLSRKVLGDENE